MFFCLWQLWKLFLLFNVCYLNFTSYLFQPKIHTHTHTHASTHAPIHQPTLRFPLRDKVTGRLLKLYFYIAEAAEWSRALDIILSDWCCSVSMVSVQIPSREEQKLSAQRSNSNTVGFNFQTYIYIYIWLLIFLNILNTQERIWCPVTLNAMVTYINPIVICRYIQSL